MNEDDVTCPLCVQWRCAKCKSDLWPQCCGGGWTDADSEPYWPDGTVAELTQNEWCDFCTRAVSQMYKEPR